MKLQPNTLLKGGTYRIIDTLGKGGFGITYLAGHTHMGRKVCIKEFFPTTLYRRDNVSQMATIKDEDNAAMCERYKQKFLKEARTISTLDNPHIVRVFDSFEEHGTAYYVMEYIEGESLQSLVSRKGALDETTARRYIGQVADALAYIHERNTLHLDIKPSNIMVRKSDGRAILIDFGLAKHYDEDSGSQTTTTIGGHSDGYAPIEQYDTGGVQVFSPETDIYSLGATLYFLVTGECPPRARVIGNQGLPAMPSKLSASLRKAVENAMEFSIKQRPHSVREFITTLNGGGTTKRGKWWLWLLITILLLAIGGAVGYLMLGNDTPALTPNVMDRREPPVETVFEDESIPLEEPTPKPVKQQSTPTDQRQDKAPAHETEAMTESSKQTSGEAEKTETVNPAALFKPVVGNSSERVPEGNRLAPDGEKEQNKGEGAGYNLQGTNQLDAGLQGRGLREGLPMPSTHYNTEGIVAVSVLVDSDGNVTSAKVCLSGTTTTDATLQHLAVEAAKKAKFRPSEQAMQGGTITFVFRLQ